MNMSNKCPGEGKSVQSESIIDPRYKAGFRIPPQEWTKVDPRGIEYGFFQVLRKEGGTELDPVDIYEVTWRQRTCGCEAAGRTPYTYTIQIHGRENFMRWAAENT